MSPRGEPERRIETRFHFFWEDPDGLGVFGFPDAGGGPLLGGTTLRGAFVVEIDDEELPYELVFLVDAFEGRLAPKSIAINQRQGFPPDTPAGSPITATGLREVRVTAYMEVIRSRLPELGAITKGTRGTRLGRSVIVHQPLAPEEVQRHLEDQRRRRNPDDLIPEVVRRYRAALSDPSTARRATQVVAEEMAYSRGHISRLLTEARVRGLLGPRIRGLSGEEASDQEESS
jgi:hypothetical protein